MKRTYLKFIKYLDVGMVMGADSEIAGKIRMQQIRSIADTAPAMLLCTLICAGTLFVMLWGQSMDWLLAPWLLVVWLLTGFGLYGVYSKRKKKNSLALINKKTVSKRAHKKVIKVASFVACIWALIPLVGYPSVSQSHLSIIVAITAGILGGGTLAFYVIPRAMFAWLAIITTAASAGLLLEGSAISFGLLVLLLAYSATLFGSGVLIARIYAQAQISNIEVTEQSDTIGILLREFSENARDWLWELSSTGTVIRGGKEFEIALKTRFRTLNSDMDAKPELAPSDIVINQRSLEPLRNAIAEKKSFRDLVIQSKGPEESCWVSLSGKPLLNTSGDFVGFRGVASNITQRKLDEERIAFLAHNDALTGLVNRARFSRALEKKLEDHRDGETWSVLYLDLDGFKSINDQNGHGTGDILLNTVAARLKGLVPDSDTVARLGGDEFAILSVSADTVQSVSNLAETLVQELSKPYMCGDQSLEIGVSIGIAIGPTDGNDVYSLLNNADLALYRAKAEGKGTYRLYELEMDEIAKERRSLENDLRLALKNGELSVRYQPLVSSQDSKPTGFEALARWHHPVRGSVPPSDFIPIAERMGIIPEIGEWVLMEACNAAAKWPDHLTIAVNLSPQQFQSNRIVSTVVKALKESGLAPARLELEITEGLFMENTEEVMYVLRELKAMGIQIAMDDFGTGYSSLSYIMKFPFDKLKIDRTFINTVDQDDIARNVLEVITNLGEVLNLKVTAEGVETVEQVEMLKDMNCTHYQGYYFGEPLAETDLSSYLLNGLKSELIDAMPNREDAAKSLKDSA
ncbi:MAG: EAL domain-containing protein [Pseudomonadota bacterium]